MADELKVIQSGDASGSPLGDKDQTTYMAELLDVMWGYRASRFAGEEGVFDRPAPSKMRPPVFQRGEDGHNVIVKDGAEAAINQAVIAATPVESRHRWFRSMKSSQALTQSVFGNLIHHGKLPLLAGLRTEDGETAFFDEAPGADGAKLEYEVEHLGEPRSTSVDLLFEAPTRVAVECKFTEWEVGSCSRPMMEDEDARYCDGGYRRQGGRTNRCQLTEIGIRYWQEIPRLFNWAADEDQISCPLRFTYQLVRNVLSGCIAPDGRIGDDAHALLVYDARNPSFSETGAGMQAWHQVRKALKEPERVRRLSWQRLVERIEEDGELGWLVNELGAKYGLRAE
jgi:restriction endonuclease-like protein